MTTIPLSAMTATWNAGATTFTAIKMNVTDTASAAGSLLMDLQVGGTSQFKVSKGGVVYSNGLLAGADATYDIGGTGARFRDIFASRDLYAQSNTSGIYIGAASDVALFRDAGNVLAQRRATNAQTYNLYATYSSSTNYQRLGLTSASTTLSALNGASVTATNLIPAGAVVVGVTTRVSTEITGATGYQIGTALDADRWGDITGVAVGTTSDNTNWTAGTIECFTAATNVVITAKTSNFTAGAISATVHYFIGQAD